MHYLHYLEFVTSYFIAENRRRSCAAQMEQRSSNQREVTEVRTSAVSVRSQVSADILEMSHGFLLLLLLLSEAGQEADDIVSDMGLRGKQGPIHPAIEVEP